MATRLEGVVDLHAHVVLEAAYGTAGEFGPVHDVDERGRERFRVGEYAMAPMPYRDSVFTDVDRRLAAMDALGIDVQMLSANPLTFFGRIPAEPATSFARATNDAMAELVAAHPDRLLGAAQLPLQDPAAAVAELERATTALGLVAAYVGSDYGVGLDEPALDDLYARLVELDVPLFVHGVTNDGIGPPPDRRLRRNGLDLVVGYTYEETLTVAALVLGGVLDRHPGLDVCISHGGGAAVFLAQRFKTMAGFRRSDVDVIGGLRRLWFDSHLEPGPALDLVVDIVGADRFVYGTNFGGWDTPTEITDFDRSLTPNAARLLRREGP
ncbi:MAG: amidohydrolase family protein [Actinomycetota bacterium]